MPHLDSYRWGSKRLSAETSNVKGFTDNVLPVQDSKVIISHDSIWHQGPSKGMYHVHCCKKEVGLDPKQVVLCVIRAYTCRYSLWLKQNQHKERLMLISHMSLHAFSIKLL